MVGAPRSGTTSLYRYLRSLESVFLPTPKYITHFRGNRYTQKLTEKDYLQHFSGITNEKIIGEVNPGYLSDPDSSILIKKKIPNAKIIILLRDPVERTFSDYNSHIAKENLNCTFRDAIMETPPSGKNFPNTGITQKNHLLERSLYNEQVKRYLETFGVTNVGIWFTENLKQNPTKVLEDIHNFLGITENIKNIDQFAELAIPKNFIIKFILRKQSIFKILRKFVLPFPTLREKLGESSYKKISKPIMLKEQRIQLENYFKDDVSNLSLLLNMKIPWLWFEKSK